MNRDLLNTWFGNVELKYPGKFGNDEYDNARAEIIRTYHNVDGLVAIYEFGKINNPGVSDLDLIFIFDNSICNINIGRDFTNRTIPKLAKDILCGSTLMVISETSFKNILVWDDLKFKKIYGKDITINDVNSRDKKIRNIIQVMDWLPERILSIKRQLYSEELSLIRFLGLLHSLNYTLDKMIHNGYVPQQRVEKYVDHINLTSKARKSFFSYDSRQLREILFSLTENALSLGYQGMSDVSENISGYQCRNQNKCEGQVLGRFMLTNDYGYEFFKIEEYLKFANSTLYLKKSVIPVPLIWKRHFMIYGETRGFISDRIMAAFSNGSSISGKVDAEIHNFMRKRIEHCNLMADFLVKNGFSRGLIKFGWFFNLMELPENKNS